MRPYFMFLLNEWTKCFNFPYCLAIMGTKWQMNSLWHICLEQWPPEDLCRSHKQGLKAAVYIRHTGKSSRSALHSVSPLTLLFLVMVGFCRGKKQAQNIDCFVLVSSFWKQDIAPSSHLLLISTAHGGRRAVGLLSCVPCFLRQVISCALLIM